MRRRFRQSIKILPIKMLFIALEPVPEPTARPSTSRLEFPTVPCESILVCGTRQTIKQFTDTAWVSSSMAHTLIRPWSESNPSRLNMFSLRFLLLLLCISTTHISLHTSGFSELLSIDFFTYSVSILTTPTPSASSYIFHPCAFSGDG